MAIMPLGPRVLDPGARDSRAERRALRRGLPVTTATREWCGFSSDLKDVVLGGGIDAQMKHGLPGHLETIL